MKIDIALLDDHPLIVEGLRQMLLQAGFNICGTFQRAEDLEKFLTEHKPALVLIDISLPDKNGLDLCRELRKKYPKLVIIILSSHAERSRIVQALENGANGYILKNSDLGELIPNLRAALDGELVFCRNTREIMLSQSASPAALLKITRREKDVLQLMAGGRTSAEIAEQLFLSPLTVETHRRNLLQKVNVKNAAELIAIAKENGWI